ncbi:Beta-glucosidase 12 [Linum perenne]
MGTTGKAYDEGVFAPGHCYPWVNRACRVGDSGIEPYIVAHNLLLAHSAAYHLYKSKYQHNDDFDEFHLRYATDSHGITTGEKDGIPIGPHLGSYWQYFYPEGLRVLLEYTKETYMDPVIYITENGLSEKDNATQTLAEALRDDSRIDFYNSHLTSVLTAMKEKQVNVKGYFAWSYADNFEWNEGYTIRFGLNYVNCTDLSRHPKHSACWKDYKDYCDLLFKEYGSKVKKWITLNEPMGTTGKAYDEGVFAPGHCSPWVNRACRVGDSGIEPYIVAHNLLLAHSAAYHLYKSKYQHLTAEIGVTYVTHWFVPYSNATQDVDAAQRALDWMYGWFMDPITFGNYPRTMVDLLGSRLPKFTEEESRLLRKSFDFLGLNYYTAYYVKHNDDFDEFHLRYATDSHGITTGLSEKDNATQTLAEALRDDSRIDFYNSHLTSVLTAMKEKQVNVKGYFAWSYADNFEWNEGYTVRFGLNYVNYTDLSRHPKHSACWKDYEDYCDLLFKEYGSKVKKWITLNEPMGTTGKAYDEGVFAPGHCSPWVNRACRVGDSGIEPYIVAHNLLLAHSAAYHLYKSKYQHLTAEIGVTYVTHWFVPYSNATKDVDAAQRALDWMYGWFMDPITFGNYPRTMVDLLGSRLPKFTEEESRLLRKSFDFLGLNYYTAYYVKHNDDFDEFHLRYATDSHGITTGE